MAGSRRWKATFGEGHPPEITVLLEDRFQDLRMTQRTRTFEDVSDSDVMNRIAQDYGLVSQYRCRRAHLQSPIAGKPERSSFLRERARSVDAEIWLDDRNLYCKLRSKRNGGNVKLNYGGELREVTVTRGPGGAAHQRNRRGLGHRQQIAAEL